MIQSIFILSPTGEVLIERHFRGVTPRSVCDYFWEKASISLNHHGGLSTATTTTSTSIGTSSSGVTAVAGSATNFISSTNLRGSVVGGGGMISSSDDVLPLYDSVPPIMEITIDENSADSCISVKGEESKSNSSQKIVYLFSILRDGLSYLAITHSEVSPLLILEFLHRVADIFVQYFGSPADESAIKDNFSTVYQLLEETLDNGWPLTTEPNALQAVIRPPTVMGKVRKVEKTF
jgi:hypothetical protein